MQIEVAVEFGVTSGGEETTPFFPVSETLTPIPVLGLRENTSYLMRVIAVSGNAEARSQQLTFTGDWEERTMNSHLSTIQWEAFRISTAFVD
jgi:hypothetical protein